eukprot:m.1525724 g.1525724  ORF g.1525724 m.1525724 type:complete len:77 (+) comp25234_c0_seq3:3739-3969(+)
MLTCSYRCGCMSIQAVVELHASGIEMVNAILQLPAASLTLTEMSLRVFQSMLGVLRMAVQLVGTSLPEKQTEYHER